MFRLFAFLIIVAIVSSPLWVAALALEPLPRVLDSMSLSVDDVDNVRRLLRDNDPRRLRDGESKRAVLTERELNLMLRHAIPEGYAARVRLARGRVTIAASMPVPDNPLGSYVNTQLVLVEDGQSLQPVAISVGRIHLPAWLAGRLATLGNRLIQGRVPEYGAMLESLESVQADEDALAVTYRWRSEFLAQFRDRGRALVLSEERRRRILAYYAAVARVGSTLTGSVSLAAVLGPLFEEAARQTDAGADPGEENRALILALGMAVQGTDPAFLGASGDAPVPIVRNLPVTLRGRRDLAQHFAISAALAAGGGGKLADAIGVFKELSDARGGSGFSFADLLADRAGVALAESATGTGARRLQSRLAGTVDETVFMPSIGQLPEGLQDLEFRSRYEDLDTDAYNRVRDEVEQRIHELALYR